MVLRHGNMIEYGPVQQIIEAPREEYTRELVSVRQIQKQEAAEQSGAVIRIDAVDAAYSNHFKVLHDVSVHVPRGQTLAVVGESGSGKSTLARVITGLLPPSAGAVFFKDEALPPAFADRGKPQLRQLQMLYQMADTAMNPRQTVDRKSTRLNSSH